MLNIKIIFSILTTALFLAGFYPYIRDIFLRKTQPHAYTWLVWVITQGTAVAGLWYGGGGSGAIGLTVSEFFVLFIFLLCFKYGTRNITRSDTVALVLCLIAILFWWQLHNPILAVLMVCFIDAVAYIPTYRKSWEEPWSETVLSYVFFLIGDLFGIFALAQYNILTVAYLSTLTVFNAILILICLLRRRKISNPILISK